LWPGRFALGKLAILEGDPGVGKSLLALDLCARLSRGQPWPDGTPSPGPWPSLVFAGEDNNRDTLIPRLQACRADLGRVFTPEEDATASRPLGLPSGAAALDEAIVRSGARLVVFDPLAEFLDPRVSTNNETSVRRALKPLLLIAEARGCVFLLIRHLNKVEGRRALYRGGGSIALVAECRSAWLLAPEPEMSKQPSDSGKSARRILAEVKNNLAPGQRSLAFEMTRAESGATTLTWMGPVAATPDTLLARPRRIPPPRPREAAQIFLRELLAGGALSSREVYRRATEAGLSVGTIQRAKKDVGVCIRWAKVGGRVLTYWMLTGEDLPETLRPKTEQDLRDIEFGRRLQREQPDNPLDEDE
jgi:hypothetical protein